MGLFKKAQPADTGEKKDLKANYTTEDHKTDLNALLSSFGTHATNVGLASLGASCRGSIARVLQRGATPERGRGVGVQRRRKEACLMLHREKRVRQQRVLGGLLGKGLDEKLCCRVPRRAETAGGWQ